MTFLIIDEFHTPHCSLAPFTLVSKGGGAGASPGEAFSPTSRAGVGQWPFNGQWHMATTTVPFRIQPLNYSGYSWGTNGGCFFFFLFFLFVFCEERQLAPLQWVCCISIWRQQFDRPRNVPRYCNLFSIGVAEEKTLAMAFSSQVVGLLD